MATDVNCDYFMHAVYKYLSEMNELEQNPAFDPAIKIKDIDVEKRTTENELSVRSSEAPSGEKNKDDTLGLAMFEEAVAAAEKPKGINKYSLIV